MCQLNVLISQTVQSDLCLCLQSLTYHWAVLQACCHASQRHRKLQALHPKVRSSDKNSCMRDEHEAQADSPQAQTWSLMDSHDDLDFLAYFEAYQFFQRRA